jgi:hypothetical protein
VFLQIARKKKWKIENCKVMRREGRKIDDESSSKVGSLSRTGYYLSEIGIW